MADRLGWIPLSTFWRQGAQHFTWYDADYKAKWDFALHLCKGVADTRPDFQGLGAGLATQTFRQLKLDGQSQKDNVKTALNAALGGVWHEARVHAEFGVGDLCVRCGLWRILSTLCNSCPAWKAERREVGMPASAPDTPPCVKLNGLLPAHTRQVLLNHEPALVARSCVHTM
eukprot:4178016-Amphidinium_carterae.1